MKIMIYAMAWDMQYYLLNHAVDVYVKILTIRFIDKYI